MVRRALLPFACLLAGWSTAAAQQASPAGDELRNIHQMLEQQGKQLDVLAQEVARLNLLLEARTGGGPAPAPSVPPAAAQRAASPQPTAIEKAPRPEGLTHEVTKGETLTSIAKHYKVTVGELLKVNKITDVRKLQIGQSLVLPPGAKPQESPNPSPEPK